MKRSKYDPKLDPKNSPRPSPTLARDLAELREERERAKAAHMGNGAHASDEITLRDHQRAERERQAARSHYQGAPSALHLVRSRDSIVVAAKSDRSVVVPMLRGSDAGAPVKPKT